MTHKINPYIYETTEDGGVIAKPNKEYDEHERKVKYKYYLQKSFIPKEYQKYTWENIKGIPPNVIDGCKKWTDSFDDGEFSLYIHGERTIGKTTLACVIGMEILRKGYNVKFIKASDLQDIFLKLQGYSNNDELRERLDRLMMADLLIVDDAFDRLKSVYWKNSPELIISEWNSCIRERVHSEKRMAFTSNVSISSLKESWGEDIYEMLSSRRGKFKEISYENKDLKLRRMEGLENG